MTDPAEIPEFPGGMTDQGSDTDVIRENALGDSGPGFGFRQTRRILRLCDEVDRLRSLADPAPVDDWERVPEGWRVEWVCPEMPQGSRCRNVEHHTIPRLVPVSPSVDPEDRA